MKNILITAAIACLWCCTSEKKDPHPQVKNKNVSIAYQRTGSGDTALVFVHGWCINKEYWQAQQSYFSNRFTTVALDLGGHGESGTNRDNWTPDEYARDVVALIKTLDLKKVILVGHSMSGAINVIAANTIPDRIVGFVGVDNFKDFVTSYTPEQQAQIDGFLDIVKKNFDTVATSYSYSSLFPPNYPDTASMNRVIRNVQQIDSTIAIKTIEQMIPAALKEGQQLSQLQLPLYLIVSDFGPVNDSVVTKYAKKGLIAKTIKGVGHYPMIEKPDEFNQQLQAVVNEIAR
ncbi:MAG: alpha/beta hydrolase [Chitinophagaceae bacterium]